jgi:hypothetical protein
MGWLNVMLQPHPSIATCIIFWGLFCWKLSELTRKDIHAQSVNLSTSISYPHSRECQLFGSFFLGFTNCDGRERKNDRNIIFRCSFIGNFFLGFHIEKTRNMFLFLTMIQKRKNIKTLGNLIYTRGLRPLVQIR